MKNPRSIFLVSVLVTLFSASPALADDYDRREPWVFEIGSDGKALRIFRRSIYLTRIE